MIKVENGRCLMEGTILELALEATVVLNQIYENAKQIEGEEAADALLVKIGRLAVGTEKMKEVSKP